MAFLISESFVLSPESLHLTGLTWLFFHAKKYKSDVLFYLLELVLTLDCTVVELSTDPAPLIISKNFRFRVS
jgi:hypothetical protein